MLRTALRPANLGLLALLLTAAAVFALLGDWQLGRSREHARTSPTEVVVPIADVLTPAAPFTGHADHQRVSVEGTWAALPLEVVSDRDLDGRTGSWVVAALTVDGTSALLPVVLGWQPTGAPPQAAPTGAADLTGRLQVSEQPEGVGDDGALQAVSSADLVTVWPGRLYTGYLVADGVAGGSADGTAGAGLTAVPSAAPRPQLDLQNLSYAFQWWLFAGFAVVMWFKIVKDRHRDELADERGDPAWEDGAVRDDVLTPDDASPLPGGLPGELPRESQVRP